MTTREVKPRPDPWTHRKETVRHWWEVPFQLVEHASAWITHYLSGWQVLEALEYLGKFSVLAAIVFYIAETGDRHKQKHYQAWQVINTAQGKGGSGGRIEALQELNQDHEPLTGVDVGGAFLQGIRLSRANLLRANLEAADVRNSLLDRANLTYANISSANLRGSNLEHANLSNANLQDADLNGADLALAKLDGADLSRADLRQADLRGVDWGKIGEIRMANVRGVKNAPAGFLEWAARKGAVAVESDEAWQAQLDSGK